MLPISKYIKKPSNILIGLISHGYMEWLGDKSLVSLLYKLQKGKLLNLDNPQTFNEKLQWLKVYDHNPIYTKLVDKIQVKQIIGQKIGKEHIVPLIGKWENPKDIPFDKLPKQFVLKCNHDQGSVVLVHDKDTINQKEVCSFLKYKLGRNNYFGTREYGYKNIRPMVFAEKYLGKTIKDYKFYCFNGVPKFLYVGQGLTRDHSLKIDYFDLNWNIMPFYRTDYKRLGMVEKPKHLAKMIDVAHKLCQDIPFVRIDLFEVNDQVYFSEFTLCPASGHMPFVPLEYDSIVGSWLTLQKFDNKTGKYFFINSEKK